MTKTDEPFCNMIESGDYNCYEFYLAATEKFGDYKQAQHMDQIIMRSEMIRDIEALAAYFSEEVGLKRGDAYTIFLPTNIESIVGFYALNKLGVIVNFVHPLLPTEVLLETIRESRSRGIMILDLLAKDFLTHDKGRDHVEAVNRSGLPVLLCHCSDYASPIKKFAAARAEALLKLPVRFQNAADYKDVMRRYNGRTVPGVERNYGDVAVYLNGGGTTGKSKTIKLTNKAINENVHKMGYIDHIEDPGEEGEIIILPFFHALGLVVTMHMTMCNAARLIPLMQFDAKLVVKLYKRNRISGIGGIPNMFKKLYRTPGFDGPHLANTRMMFVGGDDLSPKFLEDFNAMLAANGTDARLRQGYGLTEVGSVCCVNTNWVYKDGSIGKSWKGCAWRSGTTTARECPTVK